MSISPRLDGKKVLITGGLGFIGSNLVELCLERGAEVTVFDCLDPRSGGSLFNVEDFKNDIELAFYDIQNFDQVTQFITGKDIVFNCAASTSHPFSMREPWLDSDVNSRGVINLLEAARRFNPGIQFIHVGTSTQLGPLKYQPADENHPEFPMDIYSANKSVSEKYVLIYARSYDMCATVIRLSNTFGPRASIHSPEFTFNNYFVGLALQNKTITVYGDGAQKRNVLYVRDACEALVATASASCSFGRTFFAVHDDHHSVARVAEATVERIGSGSVSFIPWPASRKRIEVGDAVLSNAKIKREIGWSPRTSLETGLDLTREFYLPRLQHYLR